MKLGPLFALLPPEWRARIRRISVRSVWVSGLLAFGLWLWSLGALGCALYAAVFSFAAIRELGNVAPRSSGWRYLAGPGIPMRGELKRSLVEARARRDAPPTSALGPYESDVPRAKNPAVRQVAVGIRVSAILLASTAVMGGIASWLDVTVEGVPAAIMTGLTCVGYFAAMVIVDVVPQRRGYERLLHETSVLRRMLLAIGYPEELLRVRMGISVLALSAVGLGCATSVAAVDPSWRHLPGRILHESVPHAGGNGSSKGSTPKGRNEPGGDPAPPVGSVGAPTAQFECNEVLLRRAIAAGHVDKQSATRIVSELRYWGAPPAGCTVGYAQARSGVAVVQFLGGEVDTVVVDDGRHAHAAFSAIGDGLIEDVEVLQSLTDSRRYGLGRWQLEQLRDGSCELLEESDNAATRQKAPASVTAVAVELADDKHGFPIVSKGQLAGQFLATIVRPDAASATGYQTAGTFVISASSGVARNGRIVRQGSGSCNSAYAVLKHWGDLVENRAH